MTKEELEKEATEYTDSIEEKKHWSDENDSYAVFTREEVEQAYLAGAEPRENHIEELEKENARLKNERNAFKIYSDNAELDAIKLNEKLTKAKEIIKEFMRISVASVEEYEPEFSELIGKAEQFLQEVEK